MLFLKLTKRNSAMNHYPIIGMRSLEMHKFRDPSWIFCDLFLEISLETLIAKISGARIFYECIAKNARESSRRREESKSLPLQFSIEMLIFRNMTSSKNVCNKTYCMKFSFFSVYSWRMVFTVIGWLPSTASLRGVLPSLFCKNIILCRSLSDAQRDSEIRILSKINRNFKTK